ncbi:hypothetical protein [uncultured Kordia sp.]|uniref:hypothetical protein n=1 Tax=uncultured Kordia sp. TaxID=507699 RepID=UPI00261C2587|nr:hypothetical protein [uncultured Kordia sp.]
MKLKLDISEVDFVDSDIVDFYDSKTIFFEPTNKLPETVSFKIWGADIDKEFHWNQYVNLDDFPNIKRILDIKPERFTIKGFSTITFENVVAGKIEICPYEKASFVKLKNGENQTFKREWNISQIDTSIYFPYGACDLKLYTKGKVWFEFNPSDCVNYIDYIIDKKRNETFFGYLNEKELCANSIKYNDADPEK